MNLARPLARVRGLAGSRRAVTIAVAVAAVLIVVAGSRLTGPGATAPVPATQTTRAQPSTATPWQPPTANTTVTPTAASPSPAAIDNDDDPAPPTPGVQITAGPVDPRDAASLLVAKILNTYGRTPAEWRANLTPMLTPQLRDLYRDVDPTATHVPDGVVGTPITATSIGQGVVTAAVPVVDNTGKPLGTVTATLVGTSHQWLASQIDWAAV